MTRWEVFKQDSAGKPHQAVGSVHASDERHALITAAHVFARRPAAVSLWVVPATSVFSRTAEELAAEAGSAELSSGEAPPAEAPSVEASEPSIGRTNGKVTAAPLADHDARPFLVFRKTTNRRSMTFVDHVGTFTALSPADALAQAAAEVVEGEALAWWVVPAGAVAASQAEDAPSWFEPAKDKTYKQQSLYGSGPHPTQRRGS